MAESRLYSFTACIVLILAINICIVGKIEFLLMTLFEIIISCSLVALHETALEIWQNYKAEKERGNVDKTAK